MINEEKNKPVPKNEVTPPKAEETRNEFDPASLRLSQDFVASTGVTKLRTTISVRKPSKEWYFRVHPDVSYRLQTAVLELKEENEIYLVQRSLWSALQTESTFSPRLLLTAANRQDVVFLWPIRLPGEDGNLDSWNSSALAAANEAERHWVRLQPNRADSAYKVSIAPAEFGEPNWSNLITEPFSKLLEIAFRDKYIRDIDHPVLRRLRGEV